jgi:inner membrane protein involved in colicin E2 resistance
MVNTKQKKSIAKTVGFFCVMIGLVYLSFFIFSLDRTAPAGAFVCIVVGLVLLTLSKGRLAG